jgi:LacI family transcriptional regulator
VAFYNTIVAHYARVLQAFERRTNAHGYHMIASTIGHISLRNVLPDMYSILNHPNDGVILVDLPRTFRPYIKQLLPLPKPVVAMGIYDVPDVDTVEIDLRAGAAAAMAHLLGSEPKRLAFFGLDSADEAASIMRRAASGEGEPRAIEYVAALTAAGLPPEVIAGTGGGRRKNGEALTAYVAAHGCPDAIFCYDDEHAIAAHHALRKMGYRLPQDVLLVGCDGNDECEYLEPALSTIVQPIEAMCEAAWEFMAARLANPTAPRQHVRLSAQLVVRESSVRK